MGTRLARPLDRLYQGIYGSRLNPLYQSGTVALLCLVVALVTGVYLLIFYRVDAPYDSVRQIQQQWLLGRWIRALHRYSSDIALVAALVHAVKMLMGNRTYGPRAPAWLSGLLLTATVWFVGVTGLVMVWDVQAQLLAGEGVRLLDRLPILSEPMSRLFTDNESVPGSFFFMVMFLHVAAPLGGAFLLWLHVSRVARPVFLPPRPLRRLLIACMIAVSIAFPLAWLGPADMLAVPGRTPLDLFYGFWLVLGPLPVALAALLAASVPLWWKPKTRPRPSWVDERLCTGCESCVQDCPYQAISMVPRSEPSRVSERVARVDPNLCVSCGICAGSCAPMGVGPPERTGRDQLRWAEAQPVEPNQLVLLACRTAAQPTIEKALTLEIRCGGALHTSVIELFLRRGAAGVFVLTCPPRDCTNREGPKWLEQRVYHEREAELQARVDRRRVRLGAYSAGQAAEAAEAVRAFQAELLSLEEPAPLEPSPQECQNVV